MAINVSVEVVKPRKLAAVRRRVVPGAVGSTWRPALDQVWAFLRSQPGLRTNGHNVFIYHHAAPGGDSINADFGVEVTRSFTPSGEVWETSTPGGEAAVAVHRGGYDGLGAAHEAVHKWAKSQHRNFAGVSWEIYGDWSDDRGELETTVVYLLA